MIFKCVIICLLIYAIAKILLYTIASISGIYIAVKHYKEYEVLKQKYVDLGVDEEEAKYKAAEKMMEQYGLF